MQIIKNRMVVALFVMFAFVLCPFAVSADPLIDATLIRESNEAGEFSDFQITFLASEVIPTGGNIVYTFPDEISNDSVDYTDIDILIDGNQVDIEASVGAGVWGVDFTNNVLTVTTGSEIGLGSIVDIRIGENAVYGVNGNNKLRNPFFATTYQLEISGTFIGIEIINFVVYVYSLMHVTAFVESPIVGPGGGSGNHVGMRLRPEVITQIVIAPDINKQCKFMMADFNCDLEADFIDYSILLGWRYDASFPEYVDLNNDGKIDLIDFSRLAYFWTQ